MEGLSTVGMEALKILAESTGDNVNLNVVTLAFLSRPKFIELKHGSPEVQALWLQMLAR